MGPRSALRGIPPDIFPKYPFPNFEYLFPGLRVINPVHSAGILKLPPISDPNPIGEQYDAINPLYPPLLPPHDLY